MFRVFLVLAFLAISTTHAEKLARPSTTTAPQKVTTNASFTISLEKGQEWEFRDPSGKLLGLVTVGDLERNASGVISINSVAAADTTPRRSKFVIQSSFGAGHDGPESIIYNIYDMNFTLDITGCIVFKPTTELGEQQKGLFLRIKAEDSFNIVSNVPDGIRLDYPLTGNMGDYLACTLTRVK